MTLRAVRDEIDAGRRVGIDCHATHVDAFLGPQFAEQATEGIAAQTRDVTYARAETRRGDGHVRRVAAEALHIGTRIRGPRLVELDQRFTERNDVKPVLSHGHLVLSCAGN